MLRILRLSTLFLLLITAARLQFLNAGHRVHAAPVARQLQQATVAPMQNIQQIVAGGYHSCAVTTAGGLLCWGNNGIGELGDGTTVSTGIPVVVSSGSSGIHSVSVGYKHTCAVTTAGAALCWGFNFAGQLGDGTTLDHSVPITVSGLSTATVAISAGYSHTCAVTETGSVFCWGSNDYGQLGDGTTVGKETPVAVGGLNNDIIAVSVGGYHTCALNRTGGVLCWGHNASGQIGNGTSGNFVLTPENVTGLQSGVATISVSSAFGVAGGHSCALTTSGAVKCWGNNGSGQLGDGTNDSKSMPTDVSGVSSGATTLSVGSEHTCIHTTTGAARCWGSNSVGQLGDNTTTDTNTPVIVSGLVSNTTGISAGYSHSCAVTTPGLVKCWGIDGGTLNAQTPMDVLQTCNLLVLYQSGDGSNPALDPTNSVGCPATNFVALSPIRLTSNPAVGWSVNGWNGTSSDTYTQLTNTVIMPASAHTVTVTYTQTCYSLMPNHVGNGDNPNVSPPNSSSCAVGQYVAGESLTLTVTQPIAWHVTSWEGTDNNLSTGLTNTLTMPAMNHVVTVNFAPTCYIATFAQTGSGAAITAAPAQSPGCGSGQYVTGEVINLTASPVSGWQVASWNGTGHDASTSLTNTLSMPATNHSVTVNYTQLPTPTVTPTPTTTGTPTGTATLTATVSVTITPTVTVTPIDTTTPVITPTPGQPPETAIPAPIDPPTPTPTATVTPTPPGNALVLIYAVLDNNLQAQWSRLVNNIERGVTANADVRLFIDGPGRDDVFIYDVKHDISDICPTRINPTCSGNYVLGQNLQKGDENSAHPTTLTRFITESLSLHPNPSQLILALVGHGSGWSAGVLPSEGEIFLDQPRPWSGQPSSWSG